MQDWIHTPMDGRGVRKVLLDGKEIGNVVYANTKKGIVRVHPEPLKLDKHRKRVIEKTLRGKVEVLPC